MEVRYSITLEVILFVFCMDVGSGMIVSMFTSILVGLVFLCCFWSKGKFFCIVFGLLIFQITSYVPTRGESIFYIFLNNKIDYVGIL